LEMLVLLMQSPTDDSIEVTVTLLKDCGAMLHKVGAGGGGGADGERVDFKSEG